MDFPWNLIPDLRWNRFLNLIGAFWDAEPRVEILGVRKAATGLSVTVRWKASLAVEHVQVHVQHDGAGGGGVEYDDSTYVSSTRVDCFTDRQQDTDVTVTDTETYIVWLIPLVRQGDGTYVRYDGEGERPDHMAFQVLADPSTGTGTGTGGRGPQGAQGEQGDDGADGDDGAAGATGAQGAQGEQGDTGAAGVDGATGPAGMDGDGGAAVTVQEEAPSAARRRGCLV